jgi:ParB-like chromosome segregation protein Spo0J
MEAHAYANLFPDIDSKGFDDLVVDIRDNGLLEAITLYEDKILDGRTRFRACQVAGVEPRYVVFEGNPLAFVISKNLHRRHLDTSQRAMIAAQIANMKEGGDHCLNSSSGLVSQGTAAEMLNVSRFSVQQATTVLKHGSPELIEQVKQGEMAVNKAVGVVQPQVAEARAKAKKTHEEQKAEIAAAKAAVEEERRKYREEKQRDIEERRLAKEQREEEKRKTQEEKERYDKELDECYGFSPELIALLKGKRKSPHIDNFVFEFVQQLHKHKDKVRELIFHVESIGPHEIYLLAKELHEIGTYFIEAAHDVRDGNRKPDFKNMKLVEHVKEGESL